MTARILDRGYRSYKGPRQGTGGAIRTVWLNSVQRALGLRRSVWSKIWPLGAVVISYLPAIVLIGLVALIPDDEFYDAATGEIGLQLPSYASYFGFIIAALILFVAFVCPEILCTDRRTGMIGLYLASPLTRDSYLVAKALATATVFSLITIGPPLLMLVASIIQGTGPDGPLGVLEIFARIMAAGVSITVVYTAFSMGMSSLTDRKSFATAGIILVFLLSSVITGVLVGALGFSEDVFASNILLLPQAIVEKVHGESLAYSDVSTAATVIGAAAWTLVWATVCRVRYQKLMVTK